MLRVFLLASLLGVTQAFVGGSQPNCGDGCPDVQPEYCCADVYPGCKGTCTNKIAQWCKAGNCVHGPRGAHRRTYRDDNAGGLEALIVPDATTCPRGTFYPLDKWGLFDRQGVNDMNGGAVPAKTRSLTPCIKCAQANPHSNTREGPYSQVVQSVFYSDVDNATGMALAGSSKEDLDAYGCKVCPAGQHADMYSCKFANGTEGDCEFTEGQTVFGATVTGPTRCIDCGNDANGDPKVTWDWSSGPAPDHSWYTCKTQRECRGSPGSPSVYMVVGRQCRRTCPDGKWLMTRDCKGTDHGSPGPDGTDVENFCSDEHCHWPHEGTFVNNGEKFECECLQKYNGETVSSSSICSNVWGQPCASKVVNSSMAIANSVGFLSDISLNKRKPYDKELATRKSGTIRTMTQFWCTKPGRAGPSVFTQPNSALAENLAGDKCSLCAPGKYSEGLLAPEYSATSWDTSGTTPRYVYALEGNDEPPSCKACPTGKWSGFGANQCQNYCPAGFYWEETDTGTNCTACPNGKYSAGVNSSSCTTCPEGQFSGKSISSASLDVAMTDQRGPGKYYEHILNVTGADQCDNCYHRDANDNKGFNGYRVGALSKGVWNCSMCPAGKYAKYPDKKLSHHLYESTTGLPVKSGGDNNEPQLWVAPSSRWLFSYATDPAIINPLAWCKQCDAGKFSNASTMMSGAKGESQCLKCPSGHAPTADQSGCQKCPPGSHPGPIALFPNELINDGSKNECQSLGYSVTFLLFDLGLLFLMFLLAVFCQKPGARWRGPTTKCGACANVKVLYFVFVVLNLLFCASPLPMSDRLFFLIFPISLLVLTCCLSCCVTMRRLDAEYLAKQNAYTPSQAQTVPAGTDQNKL